MGTNINYVNVMYIRGQTYKNMYVITGALQMLYRVITKSLCTWWLQYIIRCTETFWSPCIKTTCVYARHFRLIHIPAACPFISVRTNTKKIWDV